MSIENLCISNKQILNVWTLNVDESICICHELTVSLLVLKHENGVQAILYMWPWTTKPVIRENLESEGAKKSKYWENRL